MLKTLVMTKLFNTVRDDVKVQCSDDKGASSEFLPIEEAAKKNFFRFGSNAWIPALSIDIDSHKDIEKVLKISKDNNIPTPNFIVETSKGLHVHWVFAIPIRTKNQKSLALYGKVLDELIKIFDADKHAVARTAGRIFRNPLTHPTTYLHSTTISLSKLVYILPKKEKNVKQVRPKKSSLRYKVPDFSKIPVGERNISLFDYGRHIAYKQSSNFDEEYLLSALVSANKKFEEPLGKQELIGISKSISRFMASKWKSRTTNERTIAFNRKLAAISSDKKFNELLSKLAGFGIITIKQLKSISSRKGGALFGVSKNTFEKYRKKLINFLYSIRTEAGNQLSNIVHNVVNVLESTVIESKNTFYYYSALAPPT